LVGVYGDDIQNDIKVRAVAVAAASCYNVGGHLSIVLAIGTAAFYVGYISNFSR